MSDKTPRNPVISEVAPYLNSAAQAYVDAKTRESVGEHEALYAREPGAADVLEKFGASIRALEQLELARMERQGKATEALEQVFQYADNAEKANGWTKDQTPVNLAADEPYLALRTRQRETAKQLAISSKQVSGGLHALERAHRLWTNVQTMPLPEAEKAVASFYESLGAGEVSVISRPADPAASPAAPTQSHNVDRSQRFEINAGHEGVINFEISTDELQGLPEEDIDGLLQEAGVPADKVEEVIARLRVAAGLNPKRDASSAGPGAPTPPSTPAPESKPTAPFIHSAASAKAIELDATRLGAAYADAFTGMNVTGKALAALDRMGSAFFDKLQAFSDPTAIEQALNDRRDTLMGLTHPLAKPNADHVRDVLGVGPKNTPAGMEWLFGDTKAEDGSGYNRELRELARLTKLAEAARPGGPLKHSGGLEEQKKEIFGDARTLGIFRTEEQMKEFGASCRETENIVNEHAQPTMDDMRQRLVNSAGTLPHALAKAVRLIDASLTPGKMSEEEQQRTTDEVAALLGASTEGSLSSTLEKNASAPSVIAAMSRVRAIASSQTEWDKLRGLAQELSNPATEAHFLKQRMQSKEEANIYLPQEVAALRALGQGEGEFGNFYSRMTGGERRELWQWISQRMGEQRNRTGATSLFLLLANGIYRENREIAYAEIDEKVHERLHNLRGNANMVDEKLRTRDQEQQQKVAQAREKTDREFKHKTGAAHEAGGKLADHLAKAGGLDLNL